VALVTDQHIDLDVPQFTHDDVPGVVDLLIERFLGRQEEADASLSVNGNPVPIKIFVKDVFIRTITGLVATLHGTENAKDIKVTIRLP
jgi:hypothetical protein